MDPYTPTGTDLGNPEGYQYPGLAQGQEQSAKKRYDFWNQYYRQLVGQPAATFSSPSSAPGFQQAAQNTENYAQNQLGRGSGSVDFEALKRNLGNQATLNSNTMDINSYLSNLEKNRQSQENSQIGGLTGNVGINQMDQNVNNAGLSRFADMLKLQDYIKSMKLAQSRSGGDPFQEALGALGNFAGEAIL